MIAARNLISIKEASAFTGISVSRLYKLTMPKVAGIPCYKLGGMVRFSPEELEEWLEAQRCPTMQERENALLTRTKSADNNLYGKSVQARQMRKQTAKNTNNNQ